MIFRPIGASDLARVTPLLTGDEANTLTADQFRRRFQNGQYRAEWTWIAEEAGEEGRSNPPVAVAIWWGRPQDSLPSALDGLVAAAQEGSADRITLATGLLTTAHQAYARAGADRPPDYHIFLPADWHDRQDAIAEVGWRREAAQQAGLTVALERLGHEWTPDAGLPSRTGRLTFRQEAADAVFAGLFSRVLLGTLDATSRRAAESAGPLAQARQDVRFYREKMLGQRAWWRVAQTPAGEIAGFGTGRWRPPSSVPATGSTAGAWRCLLPQPARLAARPRPDAVARAGHHNGSRLLAEHKRDCFASRVVKVWSLGQGGEAAYDMMLGDCLWRVYGMIGKLTRRCTFCPPRRPEAT